DEALVLALASGVAVPDAAARANVSERTAYRRLADPAFRARVDRARAGMVEQAIGRLSALGTESAEALRQLVAGGDGVSAAVRLGAARAALEFLFKGNEQLTLARQLADLRQQIERLRHGATDHDAGGGQTPGPTPPVEGGDPAGPGPA